MSVRIEQLLQSKYAKNFIDHYQAKKIEDEIGTEVEFPVLSELVTYNGIKVLPTLLAQIESDSIKAIGFLGGPGAGKTQILTETRALLNKLGYNVIQIQYDTFFKMFSDQKKSRELGLSDRNKLNAEMFDLIRSVIQAIKAGKYPGKTILLFENPAAGEEDRGYSTAQRIASDKELRNLVQIFKVIPDPNMREAVGKYREKALATIQKFKPSQIKKLIATLNKDSHIKIPTDIDYAGLLKTFDSMATAKELNQIQDEDEDLSNRWYQLLETSVIGTDIEQPTSSGSWKNVLLDKNYVPHYFKLARDQVFNNRYLRNLMSEDEWRKMILLIGYSLHLFKTLGFDPELGIYSSDPKESTTMPTPTVVINKYRKDRSLLYRIS